MVVSKNGTKGRQDGGGDAYVRAAQKFDSYTLHVMLNCPERWREYLVTPITNDTRRIADDAVMANSCYVRMDRQSSIEDVITAYDQRISCLEDALRTFGQFECDLDRLMGQVDLFASERKRLASLLCRVLRDDGFVWHRFPPFYGSSAIFKTSSMFSTRWNSIFPRMSSGRSSRSRSFSFGRMIVWMPSR